ncbi:MAG: nuclear transport factor 2 family protein [Anaerolineales bacterium]|nr:nuclear transport factor 2 family protein [Anaerolineales bacterium]
MQEHTQLIETFYSSFQQKDYAGMIACYHPQIHFSDPVFTNLQGQQAMAMWHMLVERGKDLTLIYNDVNVNSDTGRAHWEATYTFSTGRKVVNLIDAQFKFADGKIIEHRDYFDLWRWTRMALGPTGILLGWTPMVQNKVRQTAMDGLKKFIEKHPEYQ